MSDGVGEGAGLETGESNVTTGGAVRARAAPARVVTIVSSASDSLERASADMEMDDMIRFDMFLVRHTTGYI
jgi:hypothetical protein